MHDHDARPGVGLTELGFGAADLGNLYQPTTDVESVAAVDAAWDHGIRYFDTAPHYGLGLSERRLGMALRERPRDEFVLSTKVGRVLEDRGVMAPDDAGFIVESTLRRRWDFTRDGILRSIEGSLGRLGMDRVDIAYLHDPDDHWAAASSTGIDTLLELRDQGVVRAIGVGANQSAMPTRFVRDFDIDLVMIAGRLTLLEQESLDGLLPAARERGTGIVAAGVYNSGILSSHTIADDAHYDYARAPGPVVERARRIATLCAEHGVELPAAALQYPLRHDVVRSVVVGARTAAHVAANAARLRQHVPSGLWAALDEEGLLTGGLAHPTETRGSGLRRDHRSSR